MLQRVALGFPCWIMREQQYAECLEQSLLLSFLRSVLPLETSDYCILIPPMWSSLWEGEIAHSLYIRKVRSKQTSFWNLAFLLGVGIKVIFPESLALAWWGFIFALILDSTPTTPTTPTPKWSPWSTCLTGTSEMEVSVSSSLFTMLPLLMPYIYITFHSFPKPLKGIVSFNPSNNPIRW